MHDHDELAYSSAGRLLDAMHTGQLAPTELLDATLERIDERNGDLNAVVFLDAEGARRRAVASTERIAAGEPIGALEGLPMLLKDLFDFKPGWPATFGGVPALADRRPDLHCVFAERTERAGAVLVGKTNSPVMGMRGTCDNPLFGPARNPFDLTKNTGGSSGGSAAAVADGLVSIAEGTDAGGSIRIPAAWCGVYGIKPSFGRVPVRLRPNAFAGTYPFVAEGPITRTVSDAALALAVLSGYDSADPYSIADAPDPRLGLSGDLAGARIAYSPDFGVYPVDRRVAEVVERAVMRFAEAGATVEEVSIDLAYDHLELADLWCRMIAPLNIGTLEGLRAEGIDLLGEHRLTIPPEYVRRIEEGYHLTVHDLARDQIMRTAVNDAIGSVLDRYDFLVTPTLSAVQVDNADDGDTVGPAEVDGQRVERLIGWCMTYFVNFTGHPAASIPAGLIDGRLPVGMQIIGGRHDDVGVIRASHAFEQIQPWVDHYELCRRR